MHLMLLSIHDAVEMVDYITVYARSRQLTAPAFFKIPAHVLRGRFQGNVQKVLHLGFMVKCVPNRPKIAA
jgi:hypothetical protein